MEECIAVGIDMPVYTKSKLDSFSPEEQAIIFSYMQEGMDEDDAIDYAISCGTVKEVKKN